MGPFCRVKLLSSTMEVVDQMGSVYKWPSDGVQRFLV